MRPQFNALLLLLPALLSGCASLFTPQGSEHFDCNRKENADSPYCHSFRGATDSTNTPLPKTRYDESVSMSEADRLQGIAPAATGSNANTSAPSGGNAPDYLPGVGRAPSMNGAPVREAPVIQRVWIKQHVDSNDMLVGDTVVYKEIIAPHWSGFPTTTTKNDDGTETFPHFPAETPDPGKLSGSNAPVTNSAPKNSKAEAALYAQPTTASTDLPNTVSGSSVQNNPFNLPQ